MVGVGKESPRAAAGTRRGMMHLMVDGYGCDPERLSNRDVVERFLLETPEAIDMKPISPVHIFQLGQGLSGFVIIAESHLAIHTWPERGTVWVDVFSCKDFDADKVVEVLKEAFEIKASNVDILPRGLEQEDAFEPAFQVGGSV